MEQINLNYIPGAMYPVVHCSQGDVGRKFKINLFDGDGTFTLDGTETLRISGHKSDGNIFVYDLPSATGSFLEITLKDQMTACKGDTICEITIEKGTTKVGTANFVLQCEPSPASSGPLSESALETIDALIALARETMAIAESSAEASAQSAIESAQSASESLASANASANSAQSSANSATSSANSASQSQTYANNSSISATQSANSASASAESEANAKVSEDNAKESEENALTYSNNASTSATQSANSASASATSASQSANSASASATSASEALASKNAAKTSEDNAKASEEAVAEMEDVVAGYVESASASASDALASKNAAKTSEDRAHTFAQSSATSATNAQNSASASATSASQASASASSAEASAESAQEALENLQNTTVSSTTLSAGSSATATKTVSPDGTVNIAFGIPQGIQGEKGEKGEKGEGSLVIANPTGDATDNLSKISIDGNIFNVAGGGGSEKSYYFQLSEWDSETMEDIIYIDRVRVTCELLNARVEQPSPGATPETKITNKIVKKTFTADEFFDYGFDKEITDESNLRNIWTRVFNVKIEFFVKPTIMVITSDGEKIPIFTNYFENYWGVIPQLNQYAVSEIQRTVSANSIFDGLSRDFWECATMLRGFVADGYYEPDSDYSLRIVLQYNFGGMGLEFDRPTKLSLNRFNPTIYSKQ